MAIPGKSPVPWTKPRAQRQQIGKQGCVLIRLAAAVRVSSFSSRRAGASSGANPATVPVDWTASGEEEAKDR